MKDETPYIMNNNILRNSTLTLPEFPTVTLIVNVTLRRITEINRTAKRARLTRGGLNKS